MCAIAGLFNLNEDKPVERALLERMTNVQEHRGPDGAGFFDHPGVGLGHRRLSIIDLGGGHQPMHAGAGRYSITYNGEIYNFKSLRKTLEASGVAFETQCDTEVLLKAYIHWGEGVLERISGMFAFAIWDAHEKALFLARDRVGKKPLHYALLPGGWVAFASELKGLLEVPDLAREINPRAVEAYLALGYVPDDLCIIAGVHKLPAGHSLTLQQGKSIPAPRAYWAMSFDMEARSDRDDLPSQLLAELTKAVDARLVADVPLGAFLSGGVDSSAVVSVMSGLMDQPVKTCSIGFDVDAYDETRFADQVSAALGTDHVMKRVAQNDLSMLDKMASVFDEPFADNSCLPTYEVCRLARQHVTVALSGDGGDEVFGGYRRYKFHAAEEQLRSAIPFGVRRPVFAALGALYPKLDWAPQVLRAKSTFQALARSTAEAYFHSVSIMTERERSMLRTERMQSALSGYRPEHRFEQIISDVPDYDPLSAIQHLDFQTWLVGDILTKVDRTSMANSLEVRVPMLDHQFLDWAKGVPAAARLRSGESKWVLKKAFEGKLPTDILYRKKMGFASPLDDWMRGDLRVQVESLSRSECLNDMGLIASTGVKSLFEEHDSGRRVHGRALFAVLMLEKSVKRLLGDTEPTAAIAA